MTFKKTSDSALNTKDFQITERNITGVNGFTDLNLKSSIYSNEAFIMDGEQGMFLQLLFDYLKSSLDFDINDND